VALPVIVNALVTFEPCTTETEADAGATVKVGGVSVTVKGRFWLAA